MGNKITWEKEFSLITNRFVLKDLFRIVFITLVLFQAILILVTFVAGETVADVIMPLYVDLGIFVGMSLLFLFAMVILGNRYNAEFTVDESGISFKSGQREKKINRIVLLLQLLTKPTMSGSGFLAVSGESGNYEWGEIYKIISHEKLKVIEVKNSWRTVTRLYCTDENFEEVLNLCNEQLKKAENMRANNPTNKRVKKPFYSYILCLVFIMIFTLLATAWSYLEYGESMIPVILLTGILTSVSCFVRGGVKKIISSIAILGTIFFSYQLYFLAFEISESFMGYAVYGYEYDTTQFYMTLLGVVFLFLINIYAVVKDEE